MMAEWPPDESSRKERNDTIELKLSDIREQLNQGSVRMDGIEAQLGELKETNAIIREHIEATCEMARAASILIVPILWVAKRIRELLLLAASLAAIALGLDAFNARFGWW